MGDNLYCMDRSAMRGAGAWARLVRGVAALAQICALAGGLVLVAMVGVVLISVTGRALVPLGFTSIRGDYELVSAGVAVAAFLSLGWCHAQGGHAAVELVVERLPYRAQAAFAFGVHGLVALAAGFVGWRLAAGAADRLAYGETSQLLRLPLVWPYGAASLGALVFALVAALMAVAALGARAGGPK